MDIEGGGWTLVLQASSHSHFYYDAPIWKAENTNNNTVLNPAKDQDGVSKAFYSLRVDQSMLCMKDLKHCAGWNHDWLTPRDLSNGPAIHSCSSCHKNDCISFFCEPNSLPHNINIATPGTWCDHWHRWGYVNYVDGWGTRIRIGFSGDIDDSDSQDTLIGIGIHHEKLNCPHDYGSGFLMWPPKSKPPHCGTLPGYLFVR